MADSFGKKEREKKREKKKKDKEAKKERRKLEGPTSEFVYIDENGNFTDTPPDPLKKSKINLEDIEISTPRNNGSDGTDFSKEGIVKFFNKEKGYGFIEERGTHKSFFVHMDGLIDTIKDNDKVRFEVGKGPKGPIALEVKLDK